MNITINITEPIKRVQEFREYDLGQITTTLQDLLDNSSITVDSNIIPILKVLSIDNISKNYLIKNLTENLYNTEDYITGQDLTESDLLLIVDESQINKLNQINQDLTVTKLDKGTFVGTAETLKTDIDSRVSKVTGKSLVLDAEITKLSHLDDTADSQKPVSTAQQAAIDAAVQAQLVDSTLINAVTTSSSVPPTGNIHAIGVGAGTYPNWGGMVIPANNIGTLSRVDGVYSVYLTAFVDINKILPWVAQVYQINAQVNYLGKDWVSNAATVAGDVPGTSSKWVERLSGYVENYEIIKKADLVPGKNLFDKTKVVNGYVNSSGTISVLEPYRASEFISVLPSTNYFLSNSGNDYRAYYDINKVYISGVFTGWSNSVPFTTPANCYYVRVTCTAAALNTTQLELGTVATIYEAYKLIMNPIYGVALQSDLEDVTAATTELDNRASALEEDLILLIPEIQTHTLEQNGYIESSGLLNTSSLFKIRVFDLTNIKSVRVLLGTLEASGANAFAFYSVTSGFSNSNYISGMTFANFLAAGKNVTVDVPINALRLLVCEFNANIGTYSITGYVPSSRLDSFDERITDLEGSTNNKLIVCRGDSITAASYPTNLQTLIGANYTVQNMGVGSAWIQDIAARQGGVPFLLLNDLVIPADNITEVTIPSTGVYNKYSSSGVQLAPIYDYAKAMLEYSPCMIDNEEFIMTLTAPGSGYAANVTIRRVTAGNAFTIKAGTPIYPNSLKTYRDVLATIFFMGTNNTAGHTLDLPTYTDTIINYHNDCIAILNNSNYLVLGLFNIAQRMYNRDLASSAITNAELLAQSVAYELKMQNKFGLSFINLRKYLSSDKALKDAVRLGYMTQGTADTNAANDSLWMGKGCPAWSFMSYSSGTDFTHPNTVGYKMIAWYVHNSLKRIGV